MTEHVGDETRALLTAWEVFGDYFAHRNGFNQVAYDNVCQALSACSNSWAPSSDIPRLAANVLVDIFPATENLASAHGGALGDRLQEAAYHLQYYVQGCVDLPREDLERNLRAREERA